MIPLRRRSACRPRVRPAFDTLETRCLLNGGPLTKPVLVNIDNRTILSSAQPGVLVNDTDTDPQATLSVQSADTTSALGASVVVNPNGSYSYDANVSTGLHRLKLGESADDRFFCQVIDSNGETATGEVVVHVSGTNQAPDDAGSSNANQLLSVASPGVLANDGTVGAGGPFTVTAFDAFSEQGAAVEVHPDGSYTYDPTVSFDLQALHDGQTVFDRFTYTAQDAAGGTFTPTVTIQVTGVNAAPTPQDDELTTPANQALTGDAPGLLANDTDPNVGDSLRTIGFDHTSSDGAVVTMHSDGSYVYDPRGSAMLQALGAGDSTDDTFQYTVSDEFGATGTATVTIQVTGVNHSPIAEAVGLETDATTPITQEGPGLLAHVSDANTTDTLTITPVTEETNVGATVEITADGGFTYDPQTSLTLQALQPGQTVIDHFTYEVSDGNGGQTTGIVSITVHGEAQPPNDFATTDNHTPLTISAPGLLENDLIGANAATAIISADGTSAAGAHVVVNADGSFTYDPTTSASLQALAASQTTYDRFTYTSKDAAGEITKATVTIAVQGAGTTGTGGSSGVAVQLLFRSLLGRDADAAGLSFWMTRLDQSTPLAQVASDIWRSAEHRGQQVDAYYLSLLGRPADVAGRAAWVAGFAAGLTESQVITGFVLSGEYLAGHPSDTAFLSGLFHDLLGRNPDPAVLSALPVATASLSGQRALHASWLSGVLSGPEYRQHVLDGLFQSYLGRPVEPAAAPGYLAALLSGDQTGVSAAIVASPESQSLNTIQRK